MAERLKRNDEPDMVGQYLARIAQVPLLTAEQEVELQKAIETGLFAQKLREARSGTTVEEVDDKHIGPGITDEIVERYAGITDDELDYFIEAGNNAKHDFMEANLRLVVSVAKRLGGTKRNFLDTIQNGNVGLMRGVEKFDYTKGFKFSTYGTWWIKQAITRAASNTERTIRLPVHRHELVKRYTATKRRLERELQIEPPVELIAQELGLSPEEVKKIESDSQHPISFNAQVGDEGDTEVGELIAHDDSGHDVESDAVLAVLRVELEALIELVLDDREQMVIRRRFGFDGGSGETQKEIAEDLDVTGERVRQIQLSAIRKLRHHKDGEFLADMLATYSR